jgi:uncharacterized protein (DUF58 family)
VLQSSLYRTYRLLAAADYWVRQRFSRAGVLWLAALTAAAVVGLDTNQTMAYQAFTFLLAVALLAMGSALGFRGRFAARRVLPRFVTAGQPCAYRVIVANRSRRAWPALLLLEDPPDPRPSLEEFLHAEDAGEADNRWDRWVGYARWQALIASKRIAVIDERPLPTVPAADEVEVHVPCRPLRRGRLRLTGLSIARPDPFGLFRGIRRLPVADSLLVLPARYPVAPIELPGTRKFQPGGVALASSVGDSEEFVGLRDYRPGDPLRRIHWKSWARAGHPVVREYQDEFFVRHALVLDTFGPPGERFEAAVSVAASLACVLDTGESLLDLMFVGPRAYCLTAGRGLAHVDQMLEVLAGVGACLDTPFAALPALVIARAESLSGCLVVLLGWDDAREALVRRLDALAIPTLALVVTRPGERIARRAGTHVRVHPIEVGAVAAGLRAL